MASNFALPTLKNWAEQRLASVIKATTAANFDSAFDAFLSKNVSITVNGKHVSRDEYKKQLGPAAFEAGASVTFHNAVEVPGNQARTIEAGSVGLFYTAVIDEKLLVLGAPVTNQITSSLNLIIEEDKSLHAPHLPHGIHGDFDGRRVSALNQIILDVRDNNLKADN